MLDSWEINESSDSDDDLLGVSNYKNNSNMIIHEDLNGEKKSTTNTSKKYSKIIRPNNIKYGNISSFIPTMDMVEFKQKQNYQRMREVYNISAFVVNVHDAINFDIDLEISSDLHELYSNVVSNQYTYRELDNNFIVDPDMEKIEVPRIGTTYRCRLRGVGMNQLPHNIHVWKSNKVCIEIKQIIDRTDGWITCTLSDIDVYKRLLVDIVVNTSTGKINLREYILDKMKGDPDPIFYQYSYKRTYRNDDNSSYKYK